jgi:hypothetical protein
MVTYRDSCMVLLRLTLERHGASNPTCRPLVVDSGSHLAFVGTLCSIRLELGICLANATSVFFHYLSMRRFHISCELSSHFHLHWLRSRNRRRGWMGIASLDSCLHDPVTDSFYSSLRLRPRVMEQLKSAGAPVQLTVPPSKNRVTLQPALDRGTH